MATGTPIKGEARAGYMLRDYDLPPGPHFADEPGTTLSDYPKRTGGDAERLLGG